MRLVTQEELDSILELHRMFLNNEEEGARADLRYTDLTGAKLRGADLRYANLRGADLTGADLRYTDLTSADLRGADLRGADLTGADLRYTDLTSADLTGAKLTGAELRGANYNEGTAFFALQCPEEGAFIAYKKCNDYIIKLQIPESAKRSSATTRKCRASAAIVVEIQNMDGSNSNLLEYLHSTSYTQEPTIYKVGEITYPNKFEENRWIECAGGIHFFITRQEAVNY